jgi:hypothetical protein
MPVSVKKSTLGFPVLPGFLPFSGPFSVLVRAFIGKLQIMRNQANTENLAGFAKVKSQWN